VSVQKSKNYSVTLSSAGNVYDESQLLRSIFESIFAVTQTKILENTNATPPAKAVNPTKGDS